MKDGRLRTWLCLLFLSVLTMGQANAESLVVADRLSYEVDHPAASYAYINALFLPGDTVLSANGAGIWAQYGSTSAWQKIIGCNLTEDFGRDCVEPKEFSSLFELGQLWQIPETGEIIVFEDYCGCWLKLRLHSPDSVSAEMWKKGIGGDYLSNATAQADLLLYGIYSSRNKLIAVAKTPGDDSYRRIVNFPEALKLKLDSVWLNWAYCRPAFNEIDSTIWMTVYGYRYLYVVGWDGKMLDSIEITADDYVTPQPPVSRIHSKAVWRDWLSKWTPAEIFRYVPAGYFILQYRTGWQKYESDSLPLYSTLVWKADRTPVQLDIPKDWQFAGIRPDSCLVFGRYIRETDRMKIELIVARIEP